MKSTTLSPRQQQIQLLRLRCQLERKQMQLQAIEIRTDYSLLDELGGKALQFKYFPLLIAAGGASFLLFKPLRSAKFLQTGLKILGLWQRFSPLIKKLRASYEQATKPLQPR